MTKTESAWWRERRYHGNPTLHRDGTVSFWSVYDQQWHYRGRGISDQDLLALPSEWRDRVRRNLAKLQEDSDNEVSHETH